MQSLNFGFETILGQHCLTLVIEVELLSLALGQKLVENR
jgi:hypothetical protein